MSKTRLWRDSLSAVCTEEELRRILETAGQVEWCTRVRLRGFALARGFRHPKSLASGLLDSGRFGARICFRDPAGQNSRIQYANRWPCSVSVGILRRVRRATNGWHLKLPAAYALGGEYVKRRLKLDVALPPYLSQKRLSAFDRREERLNRRYPFRATLLTDLRKLSFSLDSRSRIAELLREKNFAPSTLRALEAVDGAAHWVRVSPRGQITTSVSGCPRELKAHSVDRRRAGRLLRYIACSPLFSTGATW